MTDRHLDRLDPSAIANTFIAGTPRAGTTALYRYLAEHPDVHASSVKEPHFFSTDLGDYGSVTDADAYQQLFAGASATVRLEGSVMYLYSSEAAANIREVVPDARYIVLLRPYVDFLRSYHQQMLANLYESEHDLRTAWRLSPERAEGRCVPKRSRCAALLDYRSVLQFGHQLRRLCDTVGRSNVQALRFVDFVADTARAYESVLAFLGLEPEGRRTFPVVNESSAFRSQRVAELVLYPPAPLPQLRTQVRRFTGRPTLGVTRRLLRWNATRPRSVPVPEEVEAEVADAVRQDQRILREEFDIELPLRA